MTNIEDLIQRLRYGVACPVSGVKGDLAQDMTEAADALTVLQQANDSLKDQLDEKDEEIKGLGNAQQLLLAELAAVRQELEEAKRDAERYRWIRRPHSTIMVTEHADRRVFAKLYAEELDNAIDAARQQTS